MTFYRYLSACLLLSSAIFLSPLQAMDKPAEEDKSSLQARRALQARRDVALVQAGLLQTKPADLHSSILAYCHTTPIEIIRTRNENFNAAQRYQKLAQDRAQDRAENAALCFKYLRLAADQGHVEAAYRLVLTMGTMRGDEVIEDSEMPSITRSEVAIKYSKMLADHGTADILIARVCAAHKGYDVAIKHYQPLADAGSEAAYELAKIYKKLQKPLLAHKYYHLAAQANGDDQGDQFAQFALGKLYENKQDYALALDYYQQAAAQEHEKAIKKLTAMKQTVLISMLLALDKLSRNDTSADTSSK